MKIILIIITLPQSPTIKFVLTSQHTYFCLNDFKILYFEVL